MIDYNLNPDATENGGKRLDLLLRKLRYGAHSGN
jgi:hypothetical protein